MSTRENIRLIARAPFMHFEMLFNRHNIIFFPENLFLPDTLFFFDLALTHICRMDFSIIINLKGQFPI